MTAAERAAALLRQLDASRQRDHDMTDTTRVSCCVDGCRSELICLCLSRHVDNLKTWRCLEHRDTPSTKETR
jgi:hypothetical protein